MDDPQTPAPEPKPTDRPAQSTAAKLLGSFIKNRFSELAKDRMGEDECWFVSGLMNLGRQWQTRDAKDRIRAMNSKDYGNGWTAPVSDHFSKTIAANSNSLGARLPRITALSGNWDARSRRAASYAEAAITTANKESGMDTLNPILAQQTVLWGVGIVKDSVAFDLSTEDVPIFGQQDPETGQAIPTGTGQPPPAASTTPAAAAPESLNASGVPSTNPQPGQPAPPTVGAPQPQAQGEQEPEPTVIGSERIPAPRLKVTLPSPFAVYIPRDCPDANMTPEVYERVTYTLGEAREMFTDYADQLSADGQGADSQGDTAYADSTSESLAAFYQSQLRRMASALTSSGGGSTASTKDADSTVSSLTCVEGWVDWSRLTKQIQREIEAEWDNDPSVVQEYADKGMTRVSAAVTYGVFGIIWQDHTLQWGENPLHGDNPYTFFQWEKNALNPNGKGGLGVVLTSLQRQLNRLDALHDRQMLSNGTTKVLAGESQQFANTWGGDPIDVMQYDDMAGKHPPQLFPAGNAGGIPQKRMQIIEEFAQLGYTEGVQTGQAPGGVDSFRGIAYLGAKAEEQRGTQRALWEMAHEMRAKKILRMANQVWTTPRKVKVAGPNNRFGMELLEGADLDFDTDQVSVIEGSSRPKSLAEKQEAINTLATAGLIDVTDPEVRDYIYDLIGMPEIDLVNELDHSKAERDLQQVLDGMQPVSSPYQQWSIVLKYFQAYTLTEEYEGLPHNVQTGILSYASWLQDMAAPPPMPVPPGGAPPPQGGGPFAGDLPTQHPGKTLSKPPQKTNPQAQQLASQSEGNAVSSQVDGGSSYHL